VKRIFYQADGVTVDHYADLDLTYAMNTCYQVNSNSPDIECEFDANSYFGEYSFKIVASNSYTVESGVELSYEFKVDVI